MLKDTTNRPRAGHGGRRIVITGTGFAGDARARLLEAVQSLGASYSGDLLQGVTTHLVCKRVIDAFGTHKYAAALEWGVHIVSLDWLLDAVAAAKAGQRLPNESDYKTDRQEVLLQLTPAHAPRPRQRAQPPAHTCNSHAASTAAEPMQCSPLPAAPHPRPHQRAPVVSTSQLSPAPLKAAAAAAAAAPQPPPPQGSQLDQQVPPDMRGRVNSDGSKGSSGNSQQALQDCSGFTFCQPSIRAAGAPQLPTWDHGANKQPVKDVVRNPAGPGMPQQQQKQQQQQQQKRHKQQEAGQQQKAVQQQQQQLQEDDAEQYHDYETLPETQAEDWEDCRQARTPNSLVQYLRRGGLSTCGATAANVGGAGSAERSHSTSRILSLGVPAAAAGAAGMADTAGVAAGVRAACPPGSDPAGSPASVAVERYDEVAADEHEQEAPTTGLGRLQRLRRRGRHVPADSPPEAQHELEDSDAEEWQPSQPQQQQQQQQQRRERKQEQQQQQGRQQQEQQWQQGQQQDSPDITDPMLISPAPTSAAAASPMAVSDPPAAPRSCTSSSLHGDSAMRGGDNSEPRVRLEFSSGAAASSSSSGCTSAARSVAPRVKPRGRLQLPEKARRQVQQTAMQGAMKSGTGRPAGGTAAAAAVGGAAEGGGRDRGVCPTPAAESSRAASSFITYRSVRKGHVAAITPEADDSVAQSAAAQASAVTDAVGAALAPTAATGAGAAGAAAGADAKAAASKPKKPAVPTHGGLRLVGLAELAEMTETACRGDRAGSSAGNSSFASPTLEQLLVRTIHDNVTATALRRQQAVARASAGSDVEGLAAVEEGADVAGTPQEQQQGLQRRLAGRPIDDSDDEQSLLVSDLPSRNIAQGAAQMAQHLGARLAHLSQREGGGEAVIPIKLMARPARGSGARAAHGLRSSAQLQFAEQVQVPWAHATFSTKERARCAIVMAEGSSSGGSNASTSMAAAANIAMGGSSKGLPSSVAFAAEPYAFYQLPNGEWWMEYYRFYSSKDLRDLVVAANSTHTAIAGDPATAAGASSSASGQHGVHLALPADFQLAMELLRGVERQHCSLERVKGELRVRKTKKVPGTARSRLNDGSAFFWRFAFDTHTLQVLTDRPAADFVEQP